jgi:hypothetical protein
MTESRISMQVTVPHSEYGACQYFMPTILREWIVAHGLDNRYVGGGSWGDGYTNGVTNCESVYLVEDINETDAIAFKLQFPKCRVFMAGQT